LAAEPVPRRAAPDVGVPENVAHLYLNQLIAGLVRRTRQLAILEPSSLHSVIAFQKYVAKLGICHRDIKPENVLVDGSGKSPPLPPTSTPRTLTTTPPPAHSTGDLKIADFGLATVYKYKGQTRKLNDRCGSPPYGTSQPWPRPSPTRRCRLRQSLTLTLCLLNSRTRARCPRAVRGGADRRLVGRNRLLRASCRE